MSNLSLLIHENKSVLITTKMIIFLKTGLIQKKMIETLPVDKVEIIIQACKDLFNQQKARIQDVACLLGLMVS